MLRRMVRSGGLLTILNNRNMKNFNRTELFKVKTKSVLFLLLFSWKSAVRTEIYGRLVAVVLKGIRLIRKIWVQLKKQLKKNQKIHVNKRLFIG